MADVYIKCFDDKVYKQEPISFTAQSEDDDVAQIFVDMLEENVKRIREQFQLPKRMIFTKADKKKYTEATTCHSCEKELGDDRVRDHCHLSGKFRGAAHNDCNLNYKVPKFFPVILHNLAGYDCHLFIKKLSSNNGKKINIVYRKLMRDILALQRRSLWALLKMTKAKNTKKAKTL